MNQKVKLMVAEHYDSRDGYEGVLTEFQLNECVFKWPEYLKCRLPIDYPAGGINGWLRRGLQVTIWHGSATEPSPMRHSSGLVAVIEHRGSNGHLEYKLYVYTVSSGEFVADFRGVLGRFHARKLQALLILAGVPSQRVTLRYGQAEEDGPGWIIEEDLREADELSVVIVGGFSKLANEQEWLKKRKTEKVHRGRLVSYEIASVPLLGKNIRIGLMSYPYGDLCLYVGEWAAEHKSLILPVFVGSAGSLVPDLARGDTVCPSCVYSDTIERPYLIKNPLLDLSAWDAKEYRHCSVQTPLQESGRFVSRAVRNKIGTADCEVYSFLTGLGARLNREAAIALFITDEAWRAEKDITQLSYRRGVVQDAATCCYEAIQMLLRSRISEI